MKQGYRTALFLVIAGFGLIFAGEHFHTVPELRPQQVGKDQLGRQVEVTGTVTDVYNAGDVTFISVREDPSLTIISFTPLTGIDNGSRIELHGRVKLYQGQLEVVAERIRPLNGQGGQQ